MISYAMTCNAGGRPYNEDSVYMCEADGQFVFALADGLGGHGGGDLASDCVTKSAINTFKRKRGEDYIERAFENAQGWLLQQKEIRGTSEEMKSTMVLLYLADGTAQWGHIGDSRLYYFDKARIAERTLDHSVPQAMVLSGKIKESEIRFHKDRSRVLRAMGTPWEGSSYSISEREEIIGDQAFLLCSDGFWELIEEKEMEKTLKQSASVAEWLQKMVKIVEKRGADTEMDNYSAICVYIE